MTDVVLRAGLVPELDVADLTASLGFYTELLGFRIAFERPMERFADPDGYLWRPFQDLGSRSGQRSPL